jgi:topoisomerase-4 subunit A
MAKAKTRENTRGPQGPGNIVDESMIDALGARYLAYALSTITQRALPDVRDGLKPVHRRILFGMRELKLSPDSGFKKCAKIVGDVMGNFHPHGDQAIYDALVRLAQGFASRYPLVDGHGNFGNIDGDSAAAYRYTEARMTHAAELLLDGLNEDTVDFRPTYSGEDHEPVVLPAGFPNLLANGANGIAVGMATSIPPHNVAELCDAALHLIKHPNARIDTLVGVDGPIKGPDFPTGGIVVDGEEAIREAYATGRGGFRLRARWVEEKLDRAGWQVVITEIPYQVQKSRLIERIAELIETKKLPLVAEISDESAEDVRLVIEPKSRAVEPAVMMESLFRLTDLESRISLNLNVLDSDGAPRVLGVRDVLRRWLDHRQVVLLRRTQKRLDQIADRLEVLAGYLIVYLNIDEVIRIVREEDDPKAELMAAFDLTDRQAEAVLNMRLRALRKLEEEGIRTEHDGLVAEQKTLAKLLKDEDGQWKTIAGEIREVRSAFGPASALGARRTGFDEAPEHDPDAVAEAFVVREPVTVVLSEKGWIRALKGHGVDISSVKFKEGDRPGFTVECQTTDKLILFASNGRFYTLGADKLPGGRGNGEPVRLMIDLDETHAPIGLFLHDPERILLLAASTGHGFLTPEKDVLAQTRAGKQVMNVGADEAVRCVAVNGDTVATIGENRKLLIFPLSEVPQLARGKGVILQKFKDGSLADVLVFNKKDGLALVDSAGRRQEIPDWKDWIGKRAQAGRLPPKGFPRSGRFRPDNTL